jgi:Zn-dependent protease
MSLAGPAFNVACALICLAPFALGFVTPDVWMGHLAFFSALALLAALQLSAAVLNLLPIPGLDGWGVIEPYLDPELAHDARKIPQGVMFAGLFVLLSVPAAGRLLWWIPLHVAAAAGVQPGIISYGWALVHFWQSSY